MIIFVSISGQYGRLYASSYIKLVGDGVLVISARVIVAV